jgi:NADH-quinone oxidoreductase subunit C
VDYSKFPGREDGPRFEVVYHLYSVTHNHRVRLKVRVEQDDAARAHRLLPLAHRQLARARGVGHVRHPLRGSSRPPPLLLYEEFVGHPLRKDYPIERRQPLIGPNV